MFGFQPIPLGRVASGGGSGMTITTAPSVTINPTTLLSNPLFMPAGHNVGDLYVHVTVLRVYDTHSIQNEDRPVNLIQGAVSGLGYLVAWRIYDATDVAFGNSFELNDSFGGQTHSSQYYYVISKGTPFTGVSASPVTSSNAAGVCPSITTGFNNSITLAMSGSRSNSFTYSSATNGYTFNAGQSWSTFGALALAAGFASKVIPTAGATGTVFSHVGVDPQFAMQLAFY